MIANLFALARQWAFSRRRFGLVALGFLVMAGALAATVNYQYDETGRLKKVTYDDGTIVDYKLDAAGNRTNVTVGVPAGIPAGITVPANSATGGYTITWQAPLAGPAVTAYQLYTSTSSTFSTESSAYTGLNTSLVVTGKPNGTYYYRVRACAGTMCSTFATGTNGVLVAIPPSVPISINVPATNNTGTFTISWGASTGTVTAYELWEATNSSFTGAVRVYNNTGVTTSLTRVAGTYYYHVRGCNGPNCSSFTAGTPNVVVTLPPSAPTSITAPTTNNTGGYRVSWASVSGTVSAYELWEATNSAFTGAVRVYNSTGTFLDFTGKANGTYYYHARACNAGGCSAYTTSASTAVALPPGPPNSITVPPTNNTGSYTISWTAPLTGTVTGYQLFEATNAAFTGESVVYSGTNVSAAFTGKADGTYYYRVRACNGTNNCSAPVAGATGNVVTRPPGTPVSITIPTGTNTTGTYVITWTAGTGNGVTFELQESKNDPLFGTPTIPYTTTSTNYSLTGKTDGTYSYRVRACNAGGCSTYRTGGSSVSVLLPPGAPVSINVPAGSNDGAIAISWGAASSGTPSSYQLYEANNSSYTGEVSVFSALGTSTSLSGRANGSFWYRVRACNASGCSGLTSGGPAVVTLPPAAPASISISSPSNNGNYSISWGAVTSGTATRYELWEANNSAYSGEAKVYDTALLSTSFAGRSQGSYWYRIRGCNVTSCGGFAQVASPQIVDTTVPGAPQNLVAASPGMSNAVLQWTAASDNFGLSGYDWKLSSQSTFTSISNVLTVQVGGLSPLQNYTFELRARDIAGNVGSVSTVNFTTLAPPPLAPTGLERQRIADCAWRGTWLASANATYYIFKQTNGPDIQTTDLIAIVNCAQGNPESNKPRSVQACNAQGCSNDSDFDVPIDTIVPTTPGTIVLGTVFPTSVSATWPGSYDVNGVAGYEYSLNSQQYAPAGGVASLNLTNLTEATPYTLTVRAYDSTGNRSLPSPMASFTTPLGPDTQPPGQPPNLVRGNLTYSDVRFDWGTATDNVGVVGYNYRLSNTTTWTVANLNQFVFLVGLDMQTTYTFEVAARDGAGLVGPVNSNTFTTPLGPPGKPVNPLAIRGGSCWWNAWWSPPTVGASTVTYYLMRESGTGIEKNVGVSQPATVNFPPCDTPSSNKPQWLKACNALGCSGSQPFTEQ